MNVNDSDLLRSPLSKRKKLAADRESKLKEAVSAEQLKAGADARALASGATPSQHGDGDASDEDEDDDEEGEVEIDEDLLKELGEDWG
jgi:RNA polymerase II subunit A C-terminal domain phosphatase